MSILSSILVTLGVAAAIGVIVMAITIKMRK